MNYEQVKRNYERGLWTSQMVATAVKKGILTAAQYEEITGMEYNSTGSYKSYYDAMTEVLS